MKNIIISLFFVATCYSQNVAVLTHEAAQSAEFKAGFPGGWPFARPVDIGTNTALPRELSAPWVVMSAAELKTQIAALEPAVEAWKPPEPLEETAKRQLAADIINDLKIIRASSGTLTAAQMSNALRRIATAILLLLETGQADLTK